eukprot:9481088-Pyramimonas_sp.AAC.1
MKRRSLSSIVEADEASCGPGRPLIRIDLPPLELSRVVWDNSRRFQGGHQRAPWRALRGPRVGRKRSTVSWL